MPSTNNKVKFVLKNGHYAKATLDPDTNAVTFGTPVAIPGAVNLSLDPEGDTEPFYADDMVYYTTVANNGYSGDLEIALIPESFRKDILKETEDANGVLVEDSTVEPEHFALLFEFSGDKKKIRHCMYYCTAARPTIEGKTNEDSKEVQTEKLEITATPLPNGLVKVKTGANTSDAVYNGWYSNVYQTEHAQVSAVLAGITIGSLQLTPAFDAGTTSYTAETVNDEDAVSATAASGTAVTILVNGVAHTSGNDATWASGTNTVTVIASKTGCTSTAYTVTVTKNGQG
jgi:phi13 family phage major tail protein